MESKEDTEYEHFCLKCGRSLGTYRLTEEERDQHNAIQVCMGCYYDLYPWLRPKPKEVE